MATASKVITRGGLAGISAGAMFVTSTIVSLLTAQQRGVLNSFDDYLFEIILIVALVLGLGAIAGLHAAQSRNMRYGRWGATGSWMASIGYALIVAVNIVTTVAGRESLFNVRLVGALAVLIGSVLLGVMTIRARVLPWWIGVLLIVGFPLGDVLDMVVGEGSEGVVFGIVWGAVGYVLLSRPLERTRPSSTSPSNATT